MEGKAPETSFLRNSRVDLNAIQSVTEIDLLEQARAYISTAPAVSLPTPPVVDKSIAGSKLTHLTQRFQSLDSNRMHWFVRLQALIYINDHLTKDEVKPYISSLIPSATQPLLKQFYEKRKTFTPFLSSILIEFTKISPLHIAEIAGEVLAYCLRDRSNQAMDCAYTICQEVPLSQASWEVLLFFIFDQQYSNLFKERYSALCDDSEAPSYLPLSVKQQLLELACESTVHYNLTFFAAKAIVSSGYSTSAFISKEIGYYAKILCSMFSSVHMDSSNFNINNASIYGNMSKGLTSLSKTVKFTDNSANFSSTPGKVQMTTSDLRSYQPESSSAFPPHPGTAIPAHSFRSSTQEKMNMDPVLPFGSTGGTSIIGAMSGLSATPSARESIEDMIGVADVNAALDNVAQSAQRTLPTIYASPQTTKKTLPVTNNTGDALEQFIKEASLGPTFFNESQVPQDADTTLNLLEHARNLISSQSAYGGDANETMNMDDLLLYINDLSKTNSTQNMGLKSRRTTNVMGVPPMGPSQTLSSPGVGVLRHDTATKVGLSPPASLGRYTNSDELEALRQANKNLELQLASANTQIQGYIERINEYNNTLVALQTESVSVGASTQLYIKNLALQGEVDSLKSNFDRLTEKYQALKERDRTMMDRLDKYESKQQQFKSMFEQATERYEAMKRATNEKIAAYKEENDNLKMELAALQQVKGGVTDLQRTHNNRDDNNSELNALRAEVEALKNDKANLTAVTKRLIAKLSAVNKQTVDN